MVLVYLENIFKPFHPAVLDLRHPNVSIILSLKLCILGLAWPQDATDSTGTAVVKYLNLFQVNLSDMAAY